MFLLNSKSILAGGIIGLTFLITFGLFTSNVELEHPEPAAEVELAAEVEPAAEVELAAEVEQVDFEAGEGL